MSKKRYPLRTARTAHGIRAQDLRNFTRTAWWARRWMSALEAMRLGPRLGRAKQYALNGQVTELELEWSHVEAKVLGSRAEPYRVSLDFTHASDEKTAKRILKDPMFMARILTDDLPIETEEMLREAGVPLFPKSEPLGKTDEGKAIYDVKMRCSCPDWMRPCKHIVAVMLLLGEEVARRPATLLSLRGIDIDELLPADAECAGNGDDDQCPSRGDGDQCPSRGDGDQCPSCGDDEEILNLPLLKEQVADNPAPLLRRLGAVPFWRGEARCVDSLTKIYKRVRAVAAEAAQGESVDLRSSK